MAPIQPARGFSGERSSVKEHSPGPTAFQEAQRTRESESVITLHAGACFHIGLVHAGL